MISTALYQTLFSCCNAASTIVQIRYTSSKSHPRFSWILNFLPALNAPWPAKKDEVLSAAGIYAGNRAMWEVRNVPSWAGTTGASLDLANADAWPQLIFLAGLCTHMRDEDVAQIPKYSDILNLASLGHSWMPPEAEKLNIILLIFHNAPSLMPYAMTVPDLWKAPKTPSQSRQREQVHQTLSCLAGSSSKCDPCVAKRRWQDSSAGIHCWVGQVLSVLLIQNFNGSSQEAMSSCDYLVMRPGFSHSVSFSNEYVLWRVRFRIVNAACGYMPKNGVNGKKKDKTKNMIPEGVLVIEDESCHRSKFVAKDDN
ncbi:hypothetical protein JOM56_013108 [Amanita muscaria]